VTLDGSGTVVLDGSGGAILGAASGSNTLDNQETIAGEGAIGDGGVKALTLDNGGTIDADVTGATLIIDTGATVTNTGTLEATNGATLLVKDSVDNQASGVILATGNGSDVTIDPTMVTNAGEVAAKDGGTVDIADSTIDNVGDGFIEAIGAGSAIKLDQATISGGTLETSAGGVIETVSGNSTFANLAIATGSQVDVNDGTSLTLQGTIDNDGTITLEGGADLDLIVSGTVTLDGSGTVVLDGSGGAILGAASGSNTLDNQETIAGEGAIGDGGVKALTLDNGGTIDADVTGARLTIDTGATVTNTGTLEATNGATLLIKDSVNNTGGVITAMGSAATVQLAGGIDIAGGTLKTGSRTSAADGIIEILTAAGAMVLLDGSAHAVTIDGYVRVDAAATLGLAGTIDNEGTVVLASALDPSAVQAMATDVVVQGHVTLQGGGHIVMTDGTDAIVSNGAAATLSNVDNTISGAGTIGDAHLTLVNEAAGTIDADICGATLTIDTGRHTISNAGTLEATHGGVLVIDSRLDNSGQVLASHDGQIQIEADVHNKAGGAITAQSCGSITFDGVCVSNDANAAIGAATGGSIAFADSYFANCGQVDAGLGGIIAFCDSSVVNHGALDGDAFAGIQAGIGGAIVFEGSQVCNTGYIGAVGGLIIFADSCIDNSGGTGGNGIVAVDGGTIAFVQCDVVNSGLIGAFAGDGGPSAILIGDSTIHNACGTISAIGAGNSVELVNSTICGGALVTDDASCGDAGIIEILAPVPGGCNTTVFDGSGSAVAIGAFVQVDAGAVLELKGSIELCDGHNGTIALTELGCGKDAVGADLKIDGWVCLDGGGAVTLAGGADAITAASCGGVLENDSTILGAGRIGNGDTSLKLINDSCGVINADNASDSPLVIDTGCVAVCNAGVLEATCGGVLELRSDVDNSCTGVIAALGQGAEVDLHAITVSGGTLVTACGGLIETVCGTTTFDDVSIACGSQVQVDDGSALALAGTIDNDGTITLAAGGDPDLVIDGCVTLDGSGVVVLNGPGDAVVGDCGEGASVLHNASGIAGAGTIGGDGLILVNEACGTIDANACGQTLTVDTGHDVSNAGLMEATNGGTLQLADDVCNSGLLSASCGGTLDVTGCSITWSGDNACAGDNGIALDHGTLLVDTGALTLDGGGAVALDCGTIAAADCGDTLNNADVITGTGSIGCGGLVLNNEGCGVIDANVCGGTLTIDTGCNTVTNLGTLEASNGGTLNIASAVDNCGGTLVASSGGLLDVQSCISGGSATIAGGTLQFDAASNVNVTFCNGESGTDYGTLVLGDAAHFCGAIDGFAGTAGNACDSDTVELAGICETSYSVQCCGNNEILTICYGDDQHLTLTFDDFKATFTIVEKDGNTYIYDPPKAGADDKAAVTGDAAADKAGGPAAATDTAADGFHVNAGPGNVGGGPDGALGTLQNGTQHEAHIGSAVLNIADAGPGNAAHTDLGTALTSGAAVGAPALAGALTGQAGVFVAAAAPAPGVTGIVGASVVADAATLHTNGAAIGALSGPADVLPGHPGGALGIAASPLATTDSHTGATLSTASLGTASLGAAATTATTQAATAWGLNFGADQFHQGPDGFATAASGLHAETPGHPGAVAVGAAHDSFTFHTDAASNLLAPATAQPVHLDHLDGPAPAGIQLAALFTSEHLGGPVAEQVHLDTIASSSMDLFHQIVASAGHQSH
jgi:hypothetical protein